MSKLEASTIDRGDVPTGCVGRKFFVASVFSDISDSSYLWGLIVPVGLQLAVTVLLLIVLKVDIFVDGWASGNIHLVYITFLTVVATLVTTFTTGVIRKLWFHCSAFLTNDNSHFTRSSIRVLAGLGELVDHFRAWRISLTFLLAGLITTSIVAGLTPRSVIRKFCFRLSNVRNTR